MGLINFSEFAIFAFLACCLCMACLSNKVVNTKMIFLIAFFVTFFINFTSIYLYGFSDVFKLFLFLFFILSAYIFPRLSLKVLFILLFLLTVYGLLFEGYKKTTQIEFVFLYIIFFLSVNLNTLNENKLNYKLLACFFLFELVQGLYFSSRTTIVFSLLFIFFLLAPTSSKRKICYSMVFLPFFYIGGMVGYYTFAEKYQLVISASNVERASMVTWCINNLPNFIFFGPGVDAFIDGASSYQFSGIRSVVPNDPHSVLMRIFIVSGTFFSACFYLIFIWPLRRLSVVNIHPFLFVLYLKVMLFLSMGTFSAGVRLIAGTGIGVLLYVLSTNKKAIE
ncbi:hypothetical protein ACN2AK_08385 [Shewanella xiamenensis]